MGSSLWQKVGASAVNCSLVILLSLPLYWLLPLTIWKASTIALFFVYNVTFRQRCLGMRLVSTYQFQPTSLKYAALYTAGFATFFYNILVPFDLLMLNTSMQCVSLKLTGNTLHANLARSGTMTREQYLVRVKDRARTLAKDGKLHEAVASICTDLRRYPEMKPSSEDVLMGLACINEGKARVLEYIDGFA